MVWGTTRKSYRDGMVKAGRLLHEYVLARLAEGNPLAEGFRIASGFTRKAAVARAAERLEVTPAKINDMIASWAVVHLLSDGGRLGRLTYAVIRTFRVCVRRATTGNGRKPVRRTLRRVESSAAQDVVDPSERERWIVKPEAASWAADIFREAVAKGWNADDACAALGEKRAMCPPSGPSGGADEDALPRPRTACQMLGHANGDGKNLFAVARSSNPKDLADLLTEMIHQSTDPRAVASLLEDRLDEIRGQESQESLEERYPFARGDDW